MQPTSDDAVIDEIREARHRISERYGHDPERLVEYYQEMQKKFADRLLPSEATKPQADQPVA